MSQRITVPYRTPAGTQSRSFTVYRSHHGPIVRASADRWISTRLMQKPIEALSQSYLRTKARSLAEYRKVMELHANSSNNTVYADADGHIAYFHPPVCAPAGRSVQLGPAGGRQQSGHRVERSSWDRRQSSCDRSAQWLDSERQQLALFSRRPLQPEARRIPGLHGQRTGESPRGLHAIMVLDGRKDFKSRRLRDAAFDTYLPAFARLVPPLVAAYDSIPASADRLKRQLAEPIELSENGTIAGAQHRWLRHWPFYWGEALAQSVQTYAADAGMTTYEYMTARVRPAEALAALQAAEDRLTQDFGSWKTPWGEINRFQRLAGDVEQTFRDSAPSIPVPFTSAQWGSLAAYGAKTYPGTGRRYGTYGNTFVAVVE